MPKVYLAAAFRKFSDRSDLDKAYGEITDKNYVDFLESIENVFLNFGFDTCLPHRDEGGWGKLYYDPNIISALCLRHVETSDFIFAITEKSRGVYIELGYAAGLHDKKIIMLYPEEYEPSTLIYGLSDNYSPWFNNSKPKIVIDSYKDTNEIIEKLSRILTNTFKLFPIGARQPRKKYCVIDLGSHTIKIKVISYKKGSSPILLFEEKKSLGIIDDILLDGTFKENTINNIMEILKKWIDDTKELHINEFILTGTAALRQATNADNLIKSIKINTGFSVEIISPESELYYIFKGVMSAFKPNHKLAILNLGGGSTQVGIGTCDNLTNKLFFDFGTKKIIQQFPWGDGFSLNKYNSLISYANDIINIDLQNVLNENIEALVHTGGELDFMLKCKLPLDISKLSLSHVSEISTEKFETFAREFAMKSLADISSSFNLDKKWAEGSVASNVIALTVAKKLKVSKIIPSNINISDGIIRAKAE